MKSTGIVRKVDELGRIVIPMELRRTLDIAEKDPLEIYTDGDRIVLRKYEPAINSPRDLIRELQACDWCLDDDLVQRMRESVS